CRVFIAGSRLSACEEALPQISQRGAGDLSAWVRLADHGHSGHSGARSWCARGSPGAGALLGNPEAIEHPSSGAGLWPVTGGTDPRLGMARARIIALLFAACGIAVPAAAQPSFYQGRQMTMIVASGAGGGYDNYARAIARYLPKYIPGNPSIVPKNVPGAGGLIVANSLYNSTTPDGLTFAALTNGAAMDPLFGETAARFDGRKFNWIGSIGKLENICVTRKQSPVTRIDQARMREITVAASGATGNSAIMPKIVNRFLHTRFKVIGGYTEGSGVTLALERGEVDGICGLSYSTLKTMRPDWFRDLKFNMILQIGLQELKDRTKATRAT